MISGPPGQAVALRSPARSRLVCASREERSCCAWLSCSRSRTFSAVSVPCLLRAVASSRSSPADLEETVAGLERELATARTRHGTLTAENVRLREQLSQAQHDLSSLLAQTSRDLAGERNATA